MADKRKRTLSLLCFQGLCCIWVVLLVVALLDRAM